MSWVKNIDFGLDLANSEEIHGLISQPKINSKFQDECCKFPDPNWKVFFAEASPLTSSFSEMFLVEVTNTFTPYFEPEIIVLDVEAEADLYSGTSRPSSPITRLSKGSLIPRQTPTTEEKFMPNAELFINTSKDCDLEIHTNSCIFQRDLISINSILLSPTLGTIRSIFIQNWNNICTCLRFDGPLEYNLIRRICDTFLNPEPIDHFRPLDITSNINRQIFSAPVCHPFSQVTSVMPLRESAIHDFIVPKLNIPSPVVKVSEARTGQWSSYGSAPMSSRPCSKMQASIRDSELEDPIICLPASGPPEKFSFLRHTSLDLFPTKNNLPVYNMDINSRTPDHNRKTELTLQNTRDLHSAMTLPGSVDTKYLKNSFASFTIPQDSGAFLQETLKHTKVIEVNQEDCSTDEDEGVFFDCTPIWAEHRGGGTTSKASTPESSAKSPQENRNLPTSFTPRKVFPDPKEIIEASVRTPVEEKRIKFVKMKKSIWLRRPKKKQMKRIKNIPFIINFFGGKKTIVPYGIQSSNKVGNSYSWSGIKHRSSFIKYKGVVSLASEEKSLIEDNDDQSSPKSQAKPAKRSRKFRKNIRGNSDNQLSIFRYLDIRPFLPFFKTQKNRVNPATLGNIVSLTSVNQSSPNSMSLPTAPAPV